MLLTRPGSHPLESVLLINKILGGQLETPAGKLMNPARRRRASGPSPSLLKHHAYGIFERSRNGVRGRNSEFSLRETFDFLTIDIPLYILETMENGSRRFAGDFRSYEWNIAEENGFHYFLMRDTNRSSEVFLISEYSVGPATSPEVAFGQRRGTWKPVTRFRAVKSPLEVHGVKSGVK